MLKHVFVFAFCSESFCVPNPTGAVTCTDYEDPYPPDPVTVTEFNINVAGEYFFQYSCTESSEGLGNTWIATNRHILS